MSRLTRGPPFSGAAVDFMGRRMATLLGWLIQWAKKTTRPSVRRKAGERSRYGLSTEGRAKSIGALPLLGRAGAERLVGAAVGRASCSCRTRSASASTTTARGVRQEPPGPQRPSRFDSSKKTRNRSGEDAKTRQLRRGFDCRSARRISNAWRRINSGGRALPIISAIASFPAARSKT